MRFFINYSGKISIDNKNIEKIPLFDLRENISLITQETFLFNESIFDNIKYGNSSATSDEILKNSPDKLEGYFAVPKVVE